MTRKRNFGVAAVPVLGMLLFCGIVFCCGSLRAQDLSSKLNDALDKEVYPLQNEAIALKNAKQFDKASRKCDQALKRLDNMPGAKDSPIAKDTQVMLRSLKNDIHAGWADFLLAEANRELDAAQEISGTGQSSMLSEHCGKAKSLAAQAMKVSKAESVKTRGNAMIQIADDRIKIDKSSASQMNRVLAEERKKQMALIKAKIHPNLEQAQKLSASAKYKEADALCGKALSDLEKLRVSDQCKNEYKVKILQCRSGARRNLLKFYIDGARQNYLSAVEQAHSNRTRSSGLANTAIQLVLEARRTVPGEGTEELKAIEDACTALIKSNNFQNETALASVDPDGKAKKEDIQVLLREGEVFYRNRLYPKARDSFEQVIILDPYNERALAMLSRIYQKISKVATLRRDNEMLERLNELEWKWNQSPLPKENEETVDASPAEYTQAAAARIEEKLNTIIIPSFEVSEQAVSEVLKELGNLCKSNDSSSVGIKFIYSPSPDQDEPQLTLSLVSVPVSVILKYLCEFTGLQYHVGDNSIIVGYIDNMERRSFKMSTSRYDTICQNIEDFYSGGGGGEGGGGAKAGGGGEAKEDNPFDGNAAGDGKFPEAKATAQQETVRVTNEQLKQYFIDLGIKFPPQATIGYNAASNMLNVTNTPENLNELASLLKETDIPIPLILIEAKILEIQVKDLEELGFDWTLSHINQNPNWMTAGGSASSYIPGTSGLFTPGVSDSISQSLLRHSDGVIGKGGSLSTDSSVGNLLVQGLQVLPNFGPDGQWNLSLDIRAIDRSERSELLQAPKVIAFNGNKASIMYAEQRYFPESWNEPEVESSSGNTYLYTPSYPEFDEGKEYGTKFDVTPLVGANNATINLMLHPIINSLSGWTSYDYKIRVGNFTTDSKGNIEGGESYAPVIKMAEISKRELTTSLKVYDGETVILGGILEEVAKRGEDKFPFMGDVPLLGRFFQDRSKNTAKTNLLIFVTARIMGLDGVPRSINSDNGLFEFYR